MFRVGFRLWAIFISHASKRLLGETENNTWPSGGQHGFSVVGYQLTGPALQAVVGVRRDFSQQWSVFGGIKATCSRHAAELEGGDRLETDLTTGAVNLGVNWRF